MQAKRYFTYIVSNQSRSVLYVGVTSNLSRRMEEHITKSSPSGFAAKYSCTDLIYYEEFNSASDAIIREKQLKGWNRSKKWNLILKLNPELKDLSELI